MDKYKSFDEYSISERASMLVAGLVNRDLPEEIQARIQSWFKSEVSEKEKYEALAGIINELKENARPDEYDERKLRELLNLLGLPYASEIETKQSKIRKVNLRRRLALRIAAVSIPVMLIIGGLYLWTIWGNDPSNPPSGNLMSVSTAASEQKHLFLPDSSQVWLNESSVLIYPADFNANREVDLKGEAYFAVHKAAGATFSVKAGGLTATVLGTQFNIKSYDQNTETEVTLHEGSLKVEAEKQTYNMKPHDRLVFDNSNNTVQFQEDTDTACVWRSGMDFYNNPLHEILTAIASHFNLELEISGLLPDDHIRFGFDYDMEPEPILGVLRNANPYFSFEITSQKLTITANR